MRFNKNNTSPSSWKYLRVCNTHLQEYKFKYFYVQYAATFCPT